MSRPRSTARPPGRARFVWQVLLVVPPVIILSVVALYSLREDRAAVDRDAARSAAALAPDLARRWGVRAGAELAALVAAGCSPAGLTAPRPPGGTPAAGVPLCGLVVDGHIRVPLDYPSVPVPPDWLPNPTPPEAVARVNAEWRLLRAQVNRQPSPEATARLTEFAGRAAGTVSESGTPLPELALLLALRHLPTGDVPEPLLAELRRRVVESPTFLTPALVDEALRVAPGNPVVAGLRVRVASHERALALLRRVPLDLAQPSEIWVEDEDGAWLALVDPLLAGTLAPAPSPRVALHVTLVPLRIVERAFRAASSDRRDVPDYASTHIRVAGRELSEDRVQPRRRVDLASATGRVDLPLVLPADTVVTFAGELLRVAPEAISATQPTPDGLVRLNGVRGGHAFAVTLELADAGRLYARYRARAWLAIALVLVATLAVLAGLAGAWRAFERQRRLGEMQANFVASVSHELRAPLASMRLMTESLDRGAIDSGDRRQQYLHVIARECRRLSSLVENVLDFSRVDRGQRQYEFALSDLSALVGDTIDLMQPYATERGVRLMSAASVTGNPQTEVDRAALQQALVNLIDNAIKHSPAGAQVTVGLELVPGRGAADERPREVEHVRLFVEDHGPGIAADEQSRIFEPFYRSGSELTRETHGVGIGLSIVKHIAEAHGGRVVVNSSPGAGSRFTIELPGVEP